MRSRVRRVKKRAAGADDSRGAHRSPEREETRLGSTAGRRRARLGATGLALAGVGLLTGCTASGTDPTVEPAAATAAAPGSSWVISSGGTGSVEENRAGTVNGFGDQFYVPQPPRPNLDLNYYQPRGVSPTLTPRQTACGGATTPRRTVPGVTVGVGSAVVTWTASDQTEVSAYRISAVSQRLVQGSQADPVEQELTHASDCTQLSLTMTGLTSGTPYVFWLEQYTKSDVKDVSRWVQVGTSDAVVIG